MSVIGWLILGLIAGFIASKIVNKSGEGVLLDVVLGIVGALSAAFYSHWSARLRSPASTSTAWSSRPSVQSRC